MKSESFSLIEQDVLSMSPRDLCFIPSTKTFCFSIDKDSTIISEDGMLKKIHQSCRVKKVQKFAYRMMFHSFPPFSGNCGQCGKQWLRKVRLCSAIMPRLRTGVS